MKTKLLLLVTIIALIGCKQLNENNSNESADTIKFNRFSIKLKNGWQHSSNPQAKAGTDQVRIVSPDSSQVLMISLTDLRTDINFTESVTSTSRAMVMRAMQNPKLKNCEITGGGNGEILWGRKGLVTSFDFIEKTDGNNNKVLLKLYNMGEIIENKKWVLFITAFLENSDQTEIENIVESIVIFD